MGKAARKKRERRAQAPAPVGKQGRMDPTRLIWLGTAGAGIVVAIVVGVLLATRSSPKAPPPASPSPADENAPAALVAAADAVGFHPNTEPGTGEIENKPASAAAPPSTSDLLPVGTKAPLFTLKTPQGKKVRLAQFRGKAVLLEFFATWCPHCAAEAPHLARLARSLGTKRYAFVSVNGDGEDAASVFAYHRYFGLPFPALLDPSTQPGSFHQQGASGPVTTEYRLSAFPLCYVIDPKGVIAWRSDGEQPDALLRQELEKAARG